MNISIDVQQISLSSYNSLFQVNEFIKNFITLNLYLVYMQNSYYLLITSLPLIVAKKKPKINRVVQFKLLQKQQFKKYHKKYHKKLNSKVNKLKKLITVEETFFNTFLVSI